MARLFDRSTGDWLRFEAFATARTLQLTSGGAVRFDDLAGLEFEGERIPLFDRHLGT